MSTWTGTRFGGRSCGAAHYRSSEPITRSFYAPTALRLWAQAERVLGRHDLSAALLARAAVVADERGGRVDRLAIAALSGTAVDPADDLRVAVAWSAAGMIEETH